MTPARLARLQFEVALAARGLSRIAGVDEAGRGPLAGPVVAAAVLFPSAWFREDWPDAFEGLDDSKKLTALQREKFYHALVADPRVRWAVATRDAAEIDRVNILRATHQAMVEAVGRLDPGPEHVLVDGGRVGMLDLPQTALVRGDSRSYSIAAASVLAKVTRDRLMVDYDRRWPQYGFAVHKGYPTARHAQALARFGPCEIHRRSFAPVASRHRELFPE